MLSSERSAKASSWIEADVQSVGDFRRLSLMTRSIPATSMPAGGDGNRLNCTSRTATSLKAPLCSSWK